MTCGDLGDLLSALSDGEVSPAQREWLELHLERCPTCQERFTGYRRVRALLAVLPADGWVPPPGPAMPRRPSSRLRLAWPRSRPWSVLISLVAGLLLGGVGTLALTGRPNNAPQQLAAALPTRVAPIAPSPVHAVGAPSSTLTSGLPVGASAGAGLSPSGSAVTPKPLPSRGAGGHALVIGNVALHVDQGASERWSTPLPKTDQQVATQSLSDPHPLAGLGVSSRGSVTAARAI